MTFYTGPRGYNFEMEDQGMKPRGCGNLQKNFTALQNNATLFYNAYFYLVLNNASDSLKILIER